MTDDGSAGPQTTWPEPRFDFRVTSDDMEMTCQEVTGLGHAPDAIALRQGGNPPFDHIRLPGQMQPATLVLKKGVVRDRGFLNWFSTVQMNRIERKDLMISLLDLTGTPTMRWSVKNALPVKVRLGDLTQDNAGTVLRYAEFAHEGLTIQTT